jgi:hypothetical protein
MRIEVLEKRMEEGFRIMIQKMEEGFRLMVQKMDEGFRTIGEKMDQGFRLIALLILAESPEEKRKLAKSILGEKD